MGHRARQDQELVAQRGRPLGLPPLVLWPQGVRLLHRPLWRRPRLWRPPQPRRLAPHRAAQEHGSRVAPEQDQGLIMYGNFLGEWSSCANGQEKKKKNGAPFFSTFKKKKKKKKKK